MFSKINISEIFTETEVFRESSPKSRFSKILTKIAIFLNFGKNRDNSKILISIKILRGFQSFSRFLKKIITKREIFVKIA